MATSVVAPPSDAAWVCMSAEQLEIQGMGMFAVKEQIKKCKWNLTFNIVCEAWKMTLAANYGDLYFLHIKALRNDVLGLYQAIVWVHPEGCGCDPMTLLSFKELIVPCP